MKRESNRMVSGRGIGRGIAAGLGALVLAAALSACEGGIGDALGLGKNAPDEFAVVRSAPLTLPPDFSLRPPRPGEARPNEEPLRDQARDALLSEAGAGDGPAAGSASQGEAAFIEQAGAGDVDPNIRHVVDREFSGYASEDESFVDSLIFWQGRRTAGRGDRRGGRSRTAAREHRGGKTRDGGRDAHHQAARQGASRRGFLS